MKTSVTLIRNQVQHLPILIVLLILAICFVLVTDVFSQNTLLPSTEKSRMFQFSNAGHVVSFKRSGVCVIDGSHMLQESFSNSNGVAPQINRPTTQEGFQTFDNVSYSDLWSGITLIYDSPAGGIIRSTYYIEPYVNPDKITLTYNVPTSKDKDGNLVFEFETGIMTASAPIAWQNIKGKQVPVNASFRLDKLRSTVHFSLGHYNPAFPLVIDPTIYWNTFMGSSSTDYCYGIDLDDEGNIYAVGVSLSGWGAPKNPHAGGWDTFVAKINSSGALQWHTFLGSPLNDLGNHISVDANKNIYITGKSSATWGAPKNPHAGGDDVFIAKLSSSGETVWHTFMGSSETDWGNSIGFDGDGNIYVTGTSCGTWGNPKNNYTGGEDAFVAKLDNDGETVWHTFMGSSFNDSSQDITIDEEGNIYVTGNSYNTWGNPINSHAGGLYEDAFVAKLNNNGELQWNTFMGSINIDNGYAIDADGRNIYVSGMSFATWGTPKNPHSGSSDAFVVKLENDGALQWSTFLGGSYIDIAYDLSMDRKGNVYVAGRSDDTWGNPLNPFSGGYEAFAAKLSCNGDLKWNTFSGGASSIDMGYGIGFDRKGNVYLGGLSNAKWGNPKNDFAGGWDAFVVKIFNASLCPIIPIFLMDSVGD